ncbi:MAG: hypothetical protein IPJ60_05185 [Sphingobacteriaceae bacterium]|nr:hypothetical protein [Sphingobacteriaceae bacterium]
MRVTIKKNMFTLCVSVLSLHIGLCQIDRKTSLDSIEKIITASKSAKERTENRLGKLSFVKDNGDTASFFKLARAYQREAKKTNDPFFLCKIHHVLGTNYYNLNELELSLNTWTRLVSLQEKIILRKRSCRHL